MFNSLGVKESWFCIFKANGIYISNRCALFIMLLKQEFHTFILRVINLNLAKVQSGSSF